MTYLAIKLIDEAIDERIEGVKDRQSQTKQKKNGRYKNGSSDRVSSLQRYIKTTNKRDNQSIFETIKERRFLVLSRSN